MSKISPLGQKLWPAGSEQTDRQTDTHTQTDRQTHTHTDTQTDNPGFPDPDDHNTFSQ